jgi:hypothetical protein
MTLFSGVHLNKRPAMSNTVQECAACNTQVDQGSFDERHLRIPR